MSNSEGPIRRRRIAGETKPAAPAKKAVAKKITAKKAPVKKAAPAKASIVKPPPVAPKIVAPPRPVARPVETAAPAAGSKSLPARELLWLVPAMLLALAALVAGSWVAVDQISNGDSSNPSVATSNQQAASAASSAAKTIFSFTYDKLPEHLTASKALMTKSFAKQFDKIAPALTELAPQRKIQVEAVARDAGALECGDSCSSTKANILVFVDQARLIGSSTQPTVFGNRITVSMVKQHGSWLVDDIRAL